MVKNCTWICGNECEHQGRVEYCEENCRNFSKQSCLDCASNNGLTICLQGEKICKIPFIKFLWADNSGTRKVYDADWPEQFIKDFTGIEVTEIGGFFIMGIQQNISSLEDAFKICRG